MNEQEAGRASEFDAAVLSLDLSRWLRSHGYLVEHEGAPAVEHLHEDAPAIVASQRRPGRPKREDEDGPIPASTVLEARRIAVLFATAQRRINKQMPKLEAIAERVAGELQRAGVFNSRGQPYGVRYLMRHALVGVQAEAQNYRKHAPDASAQIER